MADDDPSIAERMVTVRSGDAAAIKRLYVLCSVVYPHVLRMCGDAALAREVHQDTVTEIWKGRAPFRGESKFSTWVISIARNLAFKALKERAREPLRFVDIDAEEGGDTMEPVEPAADADPFQAMAARQRRDGVRCCIDKLSPKLGECLLLVHYADMSHAEVASLLGLNINTVKSRIRDAHQRLEACLKRLLN